MMEVALRFRESFLKYDKTPFIPLLETEIYNTIQKEVEEGETNFSNEEYGELIGFRFGEPHKKNKDKGGRYFQPYLVTKTSDGIEKEFPSLSQVNSEMIKYWEERVKNAGHPVLVARYSGLVFDLSEIVTSKKPNHKIGLIYIQALIDTVHLNLHKVDIYAIGKLKRALEVALILNNKNFIWIVKNEIILLENKIAQNDKPGLWGFSYDLLVNRKKKLVTDQEELEILKKLETIFEETISTDLWVAECALKRITNYNSKSNKSRVKSILYEFEKGAEDKMKNSSIFEQQNNIEKLYDYYKFFQLNADAERLLIKLREVSKYAMEQMKSVATKNDISIDELDRYTDSLYKTNNPEIIFNRIVFENIPEVNETKNSLKQNVQKSRLYYFLSKSIIDESGRTVAKVGSLENDLESNIITSIANKIQIGSIFLHLIYEEGIKRELFTTHEILKFLQKSCIIKVDRLIIIQKGLESYFNRDYITAMHLLIPQFEEAVRNLIELNGGNILIAKNDIFNLKTFDQLLTDKIIYNLFGEDATLYFRTLFTDKRGRNLRNKVAHGIMEYSEFDKQNSDRIIHAFLCLGCVRLK